MACFGAIVSSFTSDELAGNCAAVIVYDSDFPLAGEMQSLASDVNQAETAFVALNDDTPRIRWFTPSTEVALCGHATLAAAFYLSLIGLDHAAFLSASGTLHTQSHAGRFWVPLRRQSLASMDCYEGAYRKDASDIIHGARLSTWLGVAWHPEELERNVILETTGDLSDISVSLDAIGALRAGGLVITSDIPSDEFGDYQLRYFAPRCGIPEDAATGSVQAALAPLWAERKGVRDLTAVQRSKRGGLISISVDPSFVYVGGDCRLVAELRIT